MKKLWQYIKSFFNWDYIHEDGYFPYKSTDRVKFRDDFSGFTLNLDNPEVQKRLYDAIKGTTNKGTIKHRDEVK